MLEGNGYRITAKNLLCHEMIGLMVKAGMKAIAWKGKAMASGTIVDETKNVFVVESKGVERMVPKKGNWFEFVLGDEMAMVMGDDILYRPENRVKALWRHC